MPITYKGSAFKPKDVEECFVANLKTVKAHLLALGLTGFRIDFYGSGDSGSFEQPTFRDGSSHYITSLADRPGYENVPETLPIWDFHSGHTYTGGQHVFSTTTTPSDLDLEEAVRKLMEDYVNAQDVDWYNNDGGQGHVDVDLVAGTFDADISQNETVSTSVHSIDGEF